MTFTYCSAGNVENTVAKTAKYFLNTAEKTQNVSQKIQVLGPVPSYISKIKNIVKVEFLPFHTLGFSKYSEYNIENPFKNIEAMSNEKCNELYKYFSKL